LHELAHGDSDLHLHEHPDAHGDVLDCADGRHPGA